MSIPVVEWQISAAPFPFPFPVPASLALYSLAKEIRCFGHVLIYSECYSESERDKLCPRKHIATAADDSTRTAYLTVSPADPS